MYVRTHILRLCLPGDLLNSESNRRQTPLKSLHTEFKRIHDKIVKVHQDFLTKDSQEISLPMAGHKFVVRDPNHGWAIDFTKIDSLWVFILIDGATRKVQTYYIMPEEGKGKVKGNPPCKA